MEADNASSSPTKSNINVDSPNTVVCPKDLVAIYKNTLRTHCNEIQKEQIAYNEVRESIQEMRDSTMLRYCYEWYDIKCSVSERDNTPGYLGQLIAALIGVVGAVFAGVITAVAALATIGATSTGNPDVSLNVLSVVGPMIQATLTCALVLFLVYAIVAGVAIALRNRHYSRYHMIRAMLSDCLTKADKSAVSN